jgi:hypothetical protein
MTAPVHCASHSAALKGAAGVTAQQYILLLVLLGAVHLPGSCALYCLLQVGDAALLDDVCLF